MRDAFELRAQDGLGRVGELTVPRADVTVTTPALLPVVNPNKITVDPARFPEFGAEMCITNAYIIHGDPALRERALDEGLHEMLGFDGAIMTDSGSFQLAEYGEIDVTTPEILRFQRDAGSDVGTPVDIPTPPDADRDTAADDLDATTERLGVAEDVDTGDMLVNAPVQGGTHPDLREQAARAAAATDLDVFPVGAVVPLLNSYRYAETVTATLAAKRGLPADAPVHLFGAGHPMTFALAAAAGCDLFDSAAYALYARDGRYLTVGGTRHLDDMREFPCSCSVCAAHSPADLREMDAATRETRLAEHNLHVSFGELRRVREAIRQGDLLELVARRAHAHPKLLDGYRALLDAADQIERADPASKGSFFYTGPESARRPEVLRHHDRLARLDAPARLLVTDGGDHDGFDDCWDLTPPFGPHPDALQHTYPLTAETPARLDDAAFEAAADGVAALADSNPDADLTLAHHGWPDAAVAALPDGVTVVDLAAGERPEPQAGSASNAEGDR